MYEDQLHLKIIVSLGVIFEVLKWNVSSVTLNLAFRNGHLITHREKKPFECSVEGCGKSYCDARSLRRHQDNHHAGVVTTSSGGGSSNLTSVASAMEMHSPDITQPNLFSDLSCGAADLLSLPYPTSDSSSNQFAEPGGPEYSINQQQVRMYN